MININIFYNADMRERSESTVFLKQALIRCGAPEDVEIVRPIHERPYALNAPQLEFSVSHTGRVWVCAVIGAGDGNTQGICQDEAGTGAALPRSPGIDIEPADRRIYRMNSIIKKYFSEAERIFVKNMPEHMKKKRFLKLWTMKEAYLKMKGSGITDDADKSCVLTSEDAVFLSGDAQLALEAALEAACGQQITVSLCAYADSSEELELGRLEIIK